MTKITDKPGSPPSGPRAPKSPRLLRPRRHLLPELGYRSTTDSINPKIDSLSSIFGYHLFATVDRYLSSNASVVPRPSEAEFFGLNLINLKADNFVSGRSSVSLLMSIEQHYRPSDIATLMGLSSDTIRDLFKEEPGVLVIDRPEQMHKRGYSSMRIPASVAERVLDRLRVKTSPGFKRVA